MYKLQGENLTCRACACGRLLQVKVLYYKCIIIRKKNDC